MGDVCILQQLTFTGGYEREERICFSAGDNLLMLGWFRWEENDTSGQVQGRDLLVINVLNHVTETGTLSRKKAAFRFMLKRNFIN